MKVISLNVGGIKQAVERGFLDWLKDQDADVVCVLHNAGRAVDAAGNANADGLERCGGAANLRGERLRAVPLDDPAADRDVPLGDVGRVRDVVAAPGGSILVITNNTDGRGSPRPGDDRALRVDLAD